MVPSPLPSPGEAATWADPAGVGQSLGWDPCSLEGRCNLGRHCNWRTHCDWGMHCEWGMHCNGERAAVGECIATRQRGEWLQRCDAMVFSPGCSQEPADTQLTSEGGGWRGGVAAPLLLISNFWAMFGALVTFVHPQLSAGQARRWLTPISPIAG